MGTLTFILMTQASIASLVYGVMRFLERYALILGDSAFPDMELVENDDPRYIEATSWAWRSLMPHALAAVCSAAAIMLYVLAYFSQEFKLYYLFGSVMLWIGIWGDVSVHRGLAPTRHP